MLRYTLQSAFEMFVVLTSLKVSGSLALSTNYCCHFWKDNCFSFIFFNYSLKVGGIISLSPICFFIWWLCSREEQLLLLQFRVMFLQFAISPFTQKILPTRRMRALFVWLRTGSFTSLRKTACSQYHHLVQQLSHSLTHSHTKMPLLAHVTFLFKLFQISFSHSHTLTHFGSSSFNLNNECYWIISLLH